MSTHWKQRNGEMVLDGTDSSFIVVNEGSDGYGLYEDLRDGEPPLPLGHFDSEGKARDIAEEIAGVVDTSDAPRDPEELSD